MQDKIIYFPFSTAKTAPVYHELNLSRSCPPIPLFYARSVRGNRRIGLPFSPDRTFLLQSIYFPPLSANWIKGIEY